MAACVCCICGGYDEPNKALTSKYQHVLLDVEASSTETVRHRQELVQMLLVVIFLAGAAQRPLTDPYTFDIVKKAVKVFGRVCCCA